MSVDRYAQAMTSYMKSANTSRHSFVMSGGNLWNYQSKNKSGLMQPK